jgi:hypothetical protein
MPEALENDLTARLAVQLFPAVRWGQEVNPIRENALTLVRAATAASKSLPVPDLADVCVATGVSQRWLHRCLAYRRINIFALQGC